jgi:hypothetical protein
VLFITKRVRLAWTEYVSGARPLVMPNGHTLVKTHYPHSNEVIGRVLVPGPIHLSDLPELVAIHQRDDIW